MNRIRYQKMNAIILLVIFLVNILPAGVVVADLGPSLSFDSDNITATSCAESTLIVGVADVVDLTAFHLEVTFDADVIEVIDVVDGGFLSADAPVFYEPKKIDNVNGWISFGAAKEGTGGDPSPESGSGNLIEIKFKAKEPVSLGETAVYTLVGANSVLVDWPDAFEIPFTVTTGTATVTTTACEDPLALVVAETTLTGTLDDLVATFPEEIPAFFDDAGYKINSEIVLAGDVDGTITIERDGYPSLVIEDGLLAGTYTYTELYTIANGGAEPPAADFTDANYGGQVENYSITVSGNTAPIDTTVTVRSIISDDDFTSRVVLAEITLDLVVDGPNNAPVAVDDDYETDKNTPLEIDAPGVLVNDTDADSDSLTAEVVDDPENGTLTLNVDGSFTYTPDADFVGTDTFTYKVNDGTVDSNTATVTIEVKDTGYFIYLPLILK